VNYLRSRDPRTRCCPTRGPVSTLKNATVRSSINGRSRKRIDRQSKNIRVGKARVKWIPSVARVDTLKQTVIGASIKRTKSSMDQ
jgi:hypothetical protein